MLQPFSLCTFYALLGSVILFLFVVVAYCHANLLLLPCKFDAVYLTLQKLDLHKF